MLFGGLDLAVVMTLIFRVLFVVELVRDLLGLGLDQARRQVEGDQRVELVEQAALHHLTRGTGILGLEALTDLALETVEILGTELLGQLVVDLGGDRLLDGLDGHVEHGGLAGEVLCAVLFREVHFHGLLVTDLDAGQLLFEARDERARAQHQRVILGSAAFEGFAVDLADEIDHDLVAVLRLGALGPVVEILRGFRKRRQRLVDGGVIGLDHQLFDLDAGQVDLRNLGKLLVAHRHVDVVALFPVLVGHLDLGLKRRAVAAVLEMLRHGFVDRFLHGLADQALTELLLQQRHRNLALAETLHLDLGLRLGQLGVDLCVQLLGGEDQLIGAFQTFIQRLGDLHTIFLGSCAAPCLKAARLCRICGLLCVPAHTCKADSPAAARQWRPAARVGAYPACLGSAGAVSNRLSRV